MERRCPVAARFAKRAHKIQRVLGLSNVLRLRQRRSTGSKMIWATRPRGEGGSAENRLLCQPDILGRRENIQGLDLPRVQGFSQGLGKLLRRIGLLEEVNPFHQRQVFIGQILAVAARIDDLELRFFGL